MLTTTKTDRLKQAHERLTQAVQSIVTGDDWQRMLNVASKFHNYSFNNQLMIFLQRRDATHVAGFNRWRSLGRTVRKGEKGIAIFAPCKYRTKVETEDGDEQSPSRGHPRSCAISSSTPRTTNSPPCGACFHSQACGEERRLDCAGSTSRCVTDIPR